MDQNQKTNKKNGCIQTEGECNRSSSSVDLDSGVDLADEHVRGVEADCAC